MNASRHIIAVAALLVLSGTVDAETTDTSKNDSAVAGLPCEGGEAPVAKLATDGNGTIGAAVVAPCAEGDADYWTPERLRKAKPLPIPQLPADALPKLIGPKNR
jgi:hypothetical protein